MFYRIPLRVHRRILQLLTLDDPPSLEFQLRSLAKQDCKLFRPVTPAEDDDEETRQSELDKPRSALDPTFRVMCPIQVPTDAMKRSILRVMMLEKSTPLHNVKLDLVTVFDLNIFNSVFNWPEDKTLCPKRSIGITYDSALAGNGTYSKTVALFFTDQMLQDWCDFGRLMEGRGKGATVSMLRTATPSVRVLHRVQATLTVKPFGTHFMTQVNVWVSTYTSGHNLYQATFNNFPNSEQMATQIKKTCASLWPQLASTTTVTPTQYTFFGIAG